MVELLQQYSDAINGCWELAGAIFTSFSVLDLYKKKHAAGITLGALAFFTTWGIWNIIFYPVNGHMLSFYGGIVLCSVNLIWTTLFIKYTYFKPQS